MQEKARNDELGREKVLLREELRLNEVIAAQL